MKGTVDVERPDVGDRRHLDIGGRDRVDEHTTFVAGSDDADAHGVIDFRVFVVHAAQTCPRDDAGGDGSFEELAAREVGGTADGGVEVFFADFAFFGSEVHEWWVSMWLVVWCLVNRGLAPGGRSAKGFASY